MNLIDELKKVGALLASEDLGLVSDEEFNTLILAPLKRAPEQAVELRKFEQDNESYRVVLQLPEIEGSEYSGKHMTSNWTFSSESEADEFMERAVETELLDEFRYLFGFDFLQLPHDDLPKGLGLETEIWERYLVDRLTHR